MKIQQFQKKILDWYALNKRDLPWRKTTDPYRILVSEVMLQQTQVDRVVAYYERWLLELPTLRDLAHVDKQKLLQLWSGLGYNNRAVRLQKLAQEVVERFQGKIPSTEEELLSLPGIGPYTANSVQAFAFNKEVPVVDTNIRRVLIHELGLDESIGVEELKNIALSCVPLGRSCEWYNALMDYGAMEKTARKTGIKSLSQQSQFEGSDREVRGWIVKQLVAGKKITVDEVLKEFPQKSILGILTKMERDGIVKINRRLVFLA